MDKKKEEKLRSKAQNDAIHLAFDQMSDQFNTLGLNMKIVLQAFNELDWTPKSVKYSLFHPVMKAMCHVDSTTKLTSKDISKVFEQIAEVIGKEFSVEIEFPSEQNLKDYQDSLEKIYVQTSRAKGIE